MTLKARIQRLEELLDPGLDSRVEEECKARYASTIRLLVEASLVDLSPERRAEIQQARQAHGKLPLLPKHKCRFDAPIVRGTDEVDEQIHRLVQKSLTVMLDS